MPYYQRKRKSKHIKHEGITYDSKMELDLHLKELKDCIFHPPKEEHISYVTHHLYEPDFIFKQDDITYLIESKGFFRAGDIQKYRTIVNSLPENKKLVFVLSHRNKPVSKVKRKDGSVRCMEDVIESFGCRYFYKDDEGIMSKILEKKEE